jgi:hypothetical protein
MRQKIVKNSKYPRIEKIYEQIPILKQCLMTYATYDHLTKKIIKLLVLSKDGQIKLIGVKQFIGFNFR